VTSADTDKTEKFSADFDAEEPTAEELAAIAADDGNATDDVSEVEELRAEVALNLDRYQRTVADLANYRRRKDQEIMRIGTQTRRAVVQNFLPVLDDFERALTAVDGESAGAEWVEGFRLIERKLWAVLESEGVRAMEALGAPFDPSFHEAVEVENGVENADTVVGEHRRGYFIGNEVLRPAMVKVGRSNETQSDEE
jgi:molecular chaperone GrpE